MRRALPPLGLGLALLAAAAPSVAAPAAAPTLRSVRFVGPPAFTAVARDVTDAVFSLDPSIASGAGLFDDALRVPSYTPDATTKLHRRITGDLAKLRRLPWRTWDVDTQIDVRWIYAQAELVDRVATVEKLYERRPGQWLEPTANNLIALESYAPDRPELVTRVLDQVPGMIAEMRTLLTHPTRRDVETGLGLAAALEATARAHGHTAAAEAHAASVGCASATSRCASSTVAGSSTRTIRDLPSRSS